MTSRRLPLIWGHRLSSPTKPSEFPGETDVVRVENPRMAMGRLAARFNGEPAAKLHLIGITGTNGKTTVAFLRARTPCVARVGGAGSLARWSTIWAIASFPPHEPRRSHSSCTRTLRGWFALGANYA